MRNIRVELHCHTSETSLCGQLKAEDMVKGYIKKGYDGLVITDHYTSSLFNNNEELDLIIFKYYLGYRNALIAANDKIKIYRGVELRLDNSSNDYLIFGDSMNFLRRGKEIFSYDISELYKAIKEEGLALYQAHPNRDGMIQMPPLYLDGIEVYNMHTNHNSRNYLSVAFAKENNIKGISGSDAHDVSQIGRGGIFTDKLPINENELKGILLSGEYDLIF